MIKRFYEMVSDDRVGDIMDIIESKILDEYDVCLKNFGPCEQLYLERSGGIYSSRDHKFIYEYILPNGQSKFYNDAGFIISPPQIRNYMVVLRRKFFLIHLETNPKYLLENPEIIDVVKNSVSLMKSIAGLKLTNLVIGEFKNSVSLKYEIGPDNHLVVDWSGDNLNSNIIEFVNKFGGSKVVFTIASHG